MPSSDDVFQFMQNRRDAPSPLVLVHGVWSTGSGWYPQAIVACAPFFTLHVTQYGKLGTWAETFHHWTSSEQERETTFLQIAEEVLSQLPEALAATARAWQGPRPTLIAHSYGTVLVYRFLRDRQCVVEDVLLRGSPLRQSTPFNTLRGQHASVHSLLGESDPIVNFAWLMQPLGRFLGGESDVPPHHGGFGKGRLEEPETYRNAGLGGGHLTIADADKPKTWTCRSCHDEPATPVHTWAVNGWDHTSVNRQDVHRYWFPLLLGWEPAYWAAYLQSLRTLVRRPDEPMPQVDPDQLQRWLHDDTLDVFWYPYRTAVRLHRDVAPNLGALRRGPARRVQGGYPGL